MDWLRKREAPKSFVETSKLNEVAESMKVLTEALIEATKDLNASLEKAGTTLKALTKATDRAAAEGRRPIIRNYR